MSINHVDLDWLIGCLVAQCFQSPRWPNLLSFLIKPKGRKYQLDSSVCVTTCCHCSVLVKWTQFSSKSSVNPRMIGLMTHSPQVRHPCSPWQDWPGPPQQGPVSPGPLELWLLAKASAAPATCWAHQSAFVSLVSHCIIHTKGPATRAPTAPLCPELAFPKLPNSPLHLSLSLSLQPPLCQHPELKSHTPPPTTGPQPPTSSRHPPTAPPWSFKVAGTGGWWLTFNSSQPKWDASFLPSFCPSFLCFPIPKCTPGLGWERSPFSLFSWQSQKGVWMGRPWELDCVRRALVFMHSRGWAEPPGPFLLPVISFGLPSPFYLTEELGLLTLPISAQIPSPLTYGLIHFQSAATHKPPHL